MTLDANGKELTRERLRPGGGLMRVAPTAAEAAATARRAALAAGGGGGAQARGPGRCGDARWRGGGRCQAQALRRERPPAGGCRAGVPQGAGAAAAGPDAVAARCPRARSCRT